MRARFIINLGLERTYRAKVLVLAGLSEADRHGVIIDN